MRTVWRLAVVVPLVVLAACSGDLTGDPSQGQITVPPGEAPPPSDVAPPVTASPSPVSLGQSWFGRPSDEAIEAIERLGIVVAAFPVCSGSVGRGEVRQITTGDGVVLDDRDGLTDAGREVEVGSVVQMKVGNGTPCN